MKIIDIPLDGFNDTCVEQSKNFTAVDKLPQKEAERQANKAPDLQKRQETAEQIDNLPWRSDNNTHTFSHLSTVKRCSYFLTVSLKFTSILELQCMI